MKRTLTGIMLLAAISVLGLVSSPTAGAASDTPDNHWDVVGFPDIPVYWQAGVMWDDYDDGFHSDDRDNLWIQDQRGDGNSSELRVYWGGKTYKTHAYNAGRAKISIGNVPNGHKVYYRVCKWDDGDLKRCTDKYSFRE